MCYKYEKYIIFCVVHIINNIFTLCYFVYIFSLAMLYSLYSTHIIILYGKTFFFVEN